jgi:Ribbon-helix-helix protein, copG family
MNATEPSFAELRDEELARIDALASQRGLTREEMLRVVVHSGLDKLESVQAELPAHDKLEPPR